MVVSHLVDEVGSQFLSNCTNFTLHQLKTFNLAMGISGAVCLLLSFVILACLLFLRAYKTTMQRLIVYNAVLTILYQLGNVLQLEHQFNYKGQDVVCALLGGFYMYIANVTFTFAAVIITYLLYLVLKLYNTGSLSQSKRSSCLIESLCIVVAFTLPFTFLWTPVVHNGFGLGGFYCWIKDMDINCNSHYTDLIIMYSVSEVTSLEMLVASGIIFAVYCRMRTRTHLRKQYVNTLVQKTCFLVSFHAVGFAVVTVAFGLVFYLLSTNVFVPDQSLMLSVAIIFPIFYEFALIVLFLVSLRTSNIKAPNVRPRVHWAWKINSDITLKTAPSKSSYKPGDQPSYTTFTIPYTNEFTQITVNEGGDEDTELLVNEHIN